MYDPDESHSRATDAQKGARYNLPCDQDPRRRQTNMADALNEYLHRSSRREIRQGTRKNKNPMLSPQACINVWRDARLGSRMAKLTMEDMAKSYMLYGSQSRLSTYEASC